MRRPLSIERQSGCIWTELNGRLAWLAAVSIVANSRITVLVNGEAVAHVDQLLTRACNFSN